MRCGLLQKTSVGFAAAVGLSIAIEARAQPVPPFIGGPVTAFDVEIAILNSGELLDAQAVVSNDRKYVTINARADNATVVALQQFRTQTITTAGSGFVGGANPDGHSAPTGTAGARRLPSEVERSDANATSVLNQRGVYLLAPLK